MLRSEGGTVGALRLADVTVADFHCAFGGAERVTSSALAAFLANSTGETVTAHKVARILRPFGVHPVTARVGGVLAKAYRRSDFEAAIDGPPPSSPRKAPAPVVTIVAASPSETVTGDDTTTDAHPPMGARAWPGPPPPRVATSAQIDAAVAGAWAHFEGLNDITNDEAWA